MNDAHRHSAAYIGLPDLMFWIQKSEPTCSGTSEPYASCSREGWMTPYSFARRLKTLTGFTPYEYIAKIWTSEPNRFIIKPIYKMPRLNT